MVEIGSEAPLADRALEIDAGRRDKSDVHRLGACAPEPAHRVTLEHGQELALQGERQQADLIEEDRAAVRGLEQTRLRMPRVGERAALVTEQLRLEQRIGDGRS